mmetsp:Transcript_8203/g.23543  ORF Transcript_8203/g.23543 Transcript_8203/m.23543 type:complete len:508 (+) Transcript_8203:1325-2848(+)
MGPVLGLLICLGVPVRVKHYDGVCCLEVKAQASRPRGQHEDEVLRILFVEDPHVLAAVLRVGAAVEPHVFVATYLQELLQDIQLPCHLAEDQHAVACGLELGQDVVQDEHLPTCRNQLLLLQRHVLVQEEVGVVAGLSHLHHPVVELPPAAAHLYLALGGDLLEKEELPSRGVTLNNALRLIREVLLHLGLGPPQQEGADDLVKTVDDEQVLLLVQLLAHVLAAAAEGSRKPVIKRADVAEHRRQHKVEQCPQLIDRVLDGGAGEEKAVPEAVVLPEDVRQLGLCVLQPVALVHDQQVVVKLAEVGLVADDKVVVRENDVEGAPGQSLSADGGPVAGAAVVKDHLQVRRPLGKFVPPVGQHGLRGEDQMGTQRVLDVRHVGHKRHRLDGLPEAHLVGENAVHAVVVEANEEAETVNLVGAQLAIGKPRRLRHLLRHVVHEPVVFLLDADHAGRALRVPLVHRGKHVLQLLTRDGLLSAAAALGPPLLHPQAEVEDDVIGGLQEGGEP